MGARGRELGVRSAVGAPITLEGRLWGVIIALWQREGPVPVKDAEGLLVGFTELLASAIANAESRAELDASRARIVATADATRRRIERDLHDGAQQRLVSLALEVRAAQASVPPDLGELRAELSRIVEGHAGVLDELREIAQGIHPAGLADGSQVMVDVHLATIVWHGVARRTEVIATGKQPLLGTSLLDGNDLAVRFADGGPVTIQRF